MEKYYPAQAENILSNVRYKKRTGQTRAKIVCPCGNEDLAVHYVGDLREAGLFSDEYLTQRKLRGRFALAFMAACPVCGRQKLLFDSRTDGYDSVLGLKEEYDIEPLLAADFIPYSCSKCRKETFNVDMEFEYALDEDELIEDLDVKACTEEQIRNMFTWIEINVSCSCCGRWRNLVDCETA